MRSPPRRLVNGAARPDIIARTGANIVYHGPAFALLDYDSKGDAGRVAAELQQRGGFWPALLTVLPSLGNVARVTRSSTSAGLSRADTGAALPGSDGVHVYVPGRQPRVIGDEPHEEEHRHRAHGPRRHEAVGGVHQDAEGGSETEQEGDPAEGHSDECYRDWHLPEQQEHEDHDAPDADCDVHWIGAGLRSRAGRAAISNPFSRQTAAARMKPSGGSK